MLSQSLLSSLRGSLRVLAIFTLAGLLTFVAFRAGQSEGGKPRTFPHAPASATPMRTVRAQAALAPAAPAQAAVARPYVVRSPSAARRVSFDSVLFGLDTEKGAYDMGAIARTERRIGKHVGIVEFGQDWSDDFHAYLLDRIRRHGAMPIVTWEPWSNERYGRGPGGAAINQPAYTLRTIIDGEHDLFIRAWATNARRWGHPLILRFAPEMNGDWNAWSEAVNRNAPGEYVRAWRHVRRLFAAARATNVIWLWSPNIVYGDGSGSAAELPRFYPGDRWVDLVGVDGYNWGTLHPWSAWRTYERVFGPTLRILRRLTKKPLVISETSSTERGGDKAAWIREFFAQLRGERDIAAFVWFNHQKETDWRIESSPQALAAFRRGVATRRVTGSPRNLIRFLGRRQT